MTDLITFAQLLLLASLLDILLALWLLLSQRLGRRNRHYGRAEALGAFGGCLAITLVGLVAALRLYGGF